MKIENKLLVGVAVMSLILLSNHSAMAGSAFEQLVEKSKSELVKVGGKINIGLDWKKGDAGPVMAAFKKDFPFIKEIKYARETGVGPFGRYLISIKQGQNPPHDIMHVASEFQDQYLKAGAFQKPMFDYNALNASLPSGWPKLHKNALDPKGDFVSTTGNARGIIWNTKLVAASKAPTTWASCLDPAWKGKVLIDARNKLQAFQYDPNQRPRHIAWLKKLVDNDVMIIRGQGSIVRKIAGGEFPIACGINYHTAYRSIERSGVKNVKFTFAESIPLELGTRLYIPKWSRTPATAQLFALWAATEGQEPLGKFAYRGFTWNPKAHKYAASQGKYISLCGAECATGWTKFNKEYPKLLKIPVVKEKKKKK